MKTKFSLLALLILNSTFLILYSHAASYTWTGTTSTAWGTNTNWSPNGVPGAADNVTIVTATNQPLYNGVAGVTNLTMTSGTLDLNGYTLNMTGTGAFNGGTITNGKISSTGGTTTFAGTTFNCKVRTVGANLFLNGSVFNDSTYVEQTGTTNNSGVGGNKYNAWTEIVLSGTGALNMSSASPYKPDTTNADIKFTKKSAANFVAFNQGTGHRFNGKIIINCTTSSSGIMHVGASATATYNGNIEINNPAGTDIRIGLNSGASHTLLSGKTISIGGSGFASGYLRLHHFTQQGSTKQTLNLTGTSHLLLYTNTFNGPVDFKAGRIDLNGMTCKDTARIEQTYGTGWSDGGNKFDGPTTLINNNSITNSHFTMGVFAPDTFNNVLSVINKGASGSSMTFARNSSGTYFAKNVTVKCTSGGGNIGLGATASSISTCSLKAGYKIIADTFNTGLLMFYGFKQLGDTAQNIVLTGSSYLYLYGKTVFNAKTNFEAPNIFLNGAKFNKKSTFKKTGGSSNAGAGGNVFNDTVTIINNTNAGYFMLGYSYPDTFNTAVQLKNSGTNLIYMNYNYPGIYNGDIYISGAGTGSTYFGANTGTATLASGKTIIEHADGYTAGSFYLRNFTKNGTTSINLDIGNAAIVFSSGNTINGNVTVSAGAVYLSGTVFNNNVDFLQTGTVNVSGTGGNTFNGTFKVRNTGSGQFLMNNSTSLSDVFNGDAEFINEATGTGGSNGHMFIAYQGPNMQFNGSKTIFTNLSPVDRGIYVKQYGTCTFNSNIEVNNTSAGGAMDFGTYSGNITLASGKTIIVGSLGFTTGSLQLRGFYQIGNTAQSITTTGTSNVYFRKQNNTPTNRSTFDANVTVSSPRIFLSGGVFKGNVSFTATGAYTVASDGDNEYQQDFTYNNTGSGDKTFANITRDIYGGNASFTSSSGTFYIAHKGVNTFSGNITTNGSPNFYFANSGGQVVMDGDAPHIIKKINGSTTRTFTLEKPGDYTSTFKNLLLSNDAMGRSW